MRVADYVMDALYRAGGEHVFGVSGGMIMHLTDALYDSKRQEFVAMHHEAAAVMAADGAGRLTGRIGVALVTAGPGALNAIPGAAGAYIDSSPVVIVAGQAKLDQALVTGPRQFALQGYNTLPIAAQVTKLALMITRPEEARRYTEYAIWEATHGRPGPVWLEIPVDVQAMEIDPTQLAPFVPPPTPTRQLEGPVLDKIIDEVVEMLKGAKRPVILAGAGVRCANAAQVLSDIADGAGIPVLTSRLGMDLIPDTHRFFAGHPGTYGDRAANFTCQNADLIIVVGCRLAIGLIGYDFKGWAPRAKKVMVDLDPHEFTKPSIKIDLPILADAGAFLLRLKWRLEALCATPEHQALGALIGFARSEKWAHWARQIRAWRDRYPSSLAENDSSAGLNSYHFTRVMSEQAKAGDIFVVDTGSCFHVHAQAFKVQEEQRHIITGGLSTMGFMPAAIGAAAEAPNQDIWCITGDGSLQMNVQELATITARTSRIKLVVHNNDGYLLIRNTQKNFCGDRRIGEGPETGVWFPRLADLAKTYHFKYIGIASEEEVPVKLAEARAFVGPVIVEVLMDPEQALQPRVSAFKMPDGSIVSGAYDDMSPPLPRDEYEATQLWRHP